MSSIE